MENKPNYRLCKLYTFGNDTSKTWTLVFYQINGITGKLQRRFFAGFNTSKDPRKRLIEAKKWESFINTQLQNGLVYMPESIVKSIPKPIQKPTFISDLDSYLLYHSSFLVPSSYKSYRSFVDKWKAFAVAECLESLTTENVTPSICNQFVSYLLTLPINNTTRNNMITRLKTACNYYTEPGRDRWPLSPARFLTHFPASTEAHEPFTDKQAESILNAICERQEWDLLLFIYFIYYTFGRPGKEIRMLKVKDIRERTVVFKSQYSKTNITKTPTLTRPLEQLIEQLGIKDYNPEWYVFGKSGKPGSCPVSLNYYYNKHKKLITELGIGGKQTLYSWKHTGNIKLFRANVDLKSIQQQNGHTSLKTTEIYLRELGTFVDNTIYERFL